VILSDGDLRIDSHKLMYHPERVAEWLNGINIYPLYAEVAPTSTCNHRCVFCAFDYMEYIPKYIDKPVLLDTLRFLKANGLKSVMFAGEGEPFMNSDTPDIIVASREMGLDVSATTNGSLLNAEILEKVLKSMSWIRISLNAGNKENYTKIHGCNENDYDKVLENLRYAVYLKRKEQLKTTIGVQLLLIKENQNEVLEFSRILKEIGVDYYSIKPYSQHPESINRLSGALNYGECLDLETDLKREETESFKIHFRANAMKNLTLNRQYDKCLGNPFWTYIDANEKVWSCSAFLGNDEYCFGDLKENSFEEIWTSERRKKILNSIDAKKCREICRLHSINNYLYRINHPEEHDNFI